jgi:hypothetical protein
MSEERFFQASQVYEPVARLQRGDEVVYVARVGMKASKRLMILTASGEPAWPHEPFASLSDVAWSLLAHQWHLGTVEEVGDDARPARTLARLLSARA